MLSAFAPESSKDDFSLLDRFAQFGDEAAFEILMGRHGQMVWRTCQRMAHQHADAEDVFQATFLVLCRKARAIQRRESLAGWLHKVAYRIALRLNRRPKFRQLDQSQLLVANSDPFARVIQDDVRDFLDASLNRLPDKYRVPLVLCCLEGKTLKRAAAELGLPEGTLATRLARGKQKLRTHLIARNSTFSGAALASFLAEEALAQTMPRTLILATLKLKSLFLLGGTAHADRLAVMLARGAIRATLLAKITTAAIVIASVGLLAIGSSAAIYGAFGRHQPANQQETARRSPANVETQKSIDASQARVDLYGDPLPKGAIARLGSVRLRHAGMVDLAFSADGKTLVSCGCADHTARFWDVDTGQQIQARKPQSAERYWSYGTLSLDGSIMAARASWEELLTWETATGMTRRTIPVPGAQVAGLALSRTGRTLAVGYRNGTIRLWDLATGTDRALAGRHKSEVYHVLLSPDDRWLASAAYDGTIRIWDLASGEERHVIRAEIENLITRLLAFSPDGKRLAAPIVDPRDRRSSIRVWETVSGKELWKSPVKSVFPIVFSPDCKIVATSGDKSTLLRDADSGRELRRLPISASSLAFAPDGRTLAFHKGAAIHLWNLDTGNELPQRPGHSADVPLVAFSPDAKTIATAGYGDTVYLWEATTGKFVRSFHGFRQEILALAFTAGGKHIIAGGDDGMVRCWDVETGREVHHFQACDAKYPEMRLSADGGTLISTEKISGKDAYAVRIWNAATGKEIVKRRGYRKNYFHSVLSPAGDSLALIAEKEIMVEELATGRKLLSVNGSGFFDVSSVAFSPDGRTLALGEFKTYHGPNLSLSSELEAVHLWELASGTEALRLNTGPVGQIRFSPDGRFLASAGRDAVELWDIATGQKVFGSLSPEAFIGCHLDSFASCLAFSPNGQTLASGLADSTVLVWDVSPASRSSQHSTKDLHPEELEGLWSDLAFVDGVRAHAAVWSLIACRRQALSLIRRHLRPEPIVPPEDIQRALTDLNNDSFTRREAAAKELVDFGEQAEPALREALKMSPSVEKRRRIEGMLAAPRSATLRSLRAIQVLEQIGTPETKEVLLMIAQGAPEAQPTKEAKASIERLTRR
jgi:RNA polymerase sigma factor (sigma-70 family)